MKSVVISGMSLGCISSNVSDRIEDRYGMSCGLISWILNSKSLMKFWNIIPKVIMVLIRREGLSRALFGQLQGCPLSPKLLRGIYIINLGKTWEKLQMAARVIVGIENPQDIIVQSARPYSQRAVLKFAQYTGAHPIAGCHTPGTFTN